MPRPAWPVVGEAAAAPPMKTADKASRPMRPLSADLRGRGRGPAREAGRVRWPFGGLNTVEPPPSPRPLAPLTGGEERFWRREGGGRKISEPPDTTARHRGRLRAGSAFAGTLWYAR